MKDRKHRHRKGTETEKTRHRKKLTGRTNWYKMKNNRKIERHRKTEMREGDNCMTKEKREQTEQKKKETKTEDKAP